jgi:collagenase-like PrtC family protease
MNYSKMKCSDPRDTVYGLLGLAKRMLANGRDDQTMLQSNYSLSSKELCEQLEAAGIDSWKLSPWLKKAARAEG